MSRKINTVELFNELIPDDEKQAYMQSIIKITPFPIRVDYTVNSVNFPQIGNGFAYYYASDDGQLTIEQLEEIIDDVIVDISLSYGKKLNSSEICITNIAYLKKSLTSFFRSGGYINY